MSKAASGPRPSKARLVITAITLENRTVAEVVADYAVSKSWVYELLARYRAEAEAAFEPRSQRPKELARRDPSGAGAVVEPGDA
jgi:transposase